AGVDDPVVAGRGGGERARFGQVAGDVAVACGQRRAPRPVQDRDLVSGVGEDGGHVGSDVGSVGVTVSVPSVPAIVMANPPGAAALPPWMRSESSAPLPPPPWRG